MAIMDGIVMGGGVGISAHGNTRVVTDRTRLGMPEVGIGFIPDVGGTHLLSKVPDELGTYVALTAGTIRAADAIAIGLADHYIPADGLAAALDWWKPGEAFPVRIRVSRRSPSSVAGSGRRSPEIPSPTSSPDAVSSVPRGNQGGRHHRGEKSTGRGGYAAGPARGGIRRGSGAVVARRVPARAALAVQSRYGRRIRAQVIDKDRNPTWRHSAHASVTADEVDAFFEPLPVELELPIEAWTAPGE